MQFMQSCPLLQSYCFATVEVVQWKRERETRLEWLWQWPQVLLVASQVERHTAHIWVDIARAGKSNDLSCAVKLMKSLWQCLQVS